MIFNREPVLVLAVVHALIALAIGFGLDISTQQFALIESAVVAILGFIARRRVTPA